MIVALRPQLLKASRLFSEGPSVRRMTGAEMIVRWPGCRCLRSPFPSYARLTSAKVEAVAVISQRALKEVGGSENEHEEGRDDLATIPGLPGLTTEFDESPLYPPSRPAGRNA